MPRRLAITAPHKGEVLEYQDPPLEYHQVRIKTELASGKHGTTLAGFDGLNFQGQRFDQDMRLFVEAGGWTMAGARLRTSTPRLSRVGWPACIRQHCQHDA